MRGGEEHRVWPSDDRARYWKATYPGCTGFMGMPIPGSNEPDLVPALPSEYLERLLLQNQLFGDDIRLEGVAIEDSKVTVLTSQPVMIGEPAQEGEIKGALTKLWFKQLEGLHLGHPGALAFYRDLDEVAVFDAHPGNFVKDQQGVVLPIDLILVRADDSLQGALAPFLK